MTKPLGTVRRTTRGFEIIEFKDRSGNECSLQVSSIADFEKPGISAVWIGSADPAPKILASKAHLLGVKSRATEGWIDYPIPPDVSICTRAHLHRDHVKALIAHLQNWLKNDTLRIV